METRRINLERRVAPLERRFAGDSLIMCSNLEDRGLSLPAWFHAGRRLATCQHPYLHLCSRYIANTSQNARKWSARLPD